MLLRIKPEFASTAVRFRQRLAASAFTVGVASVLALSVVFTPCPAFAQGNENLFGHDQQPDLVALKETVETYRAALLQYQRTREPLAWAKAQHDLGDALAAEAEAEPGTRTLEDAVAAYRSALLERTRERAEQDWAVSALSMLGERTRDSEMLQRALAALETAADMFRLAEADRNLAATEKNIAATKASLKKLSQSVSATKASQN